MTVVFSEDVIVRGTLAPSAVTMPQDALTNSSQFKAGLNLNADKLEQRIVRSYSQPNTAATAETRTLFVARRAGTLNEVVAGSIAKAVGDSTVSIDLRKNGSTILSAVIVLDNANTNRVVEVGAISGLGTFVAGDWFETVITISAGTGTLPTGVYVQIECDQDGV